MAEHDDNRADTTTPRHDDQATSRGLEPQHRDRVRAHQALDTMAGVLPIYHEVCGAVAFHYARNELQRLRGVIDQPSLSAYDLRGVRDSIEAQTFGIVRAIRQVRGTTVEPDA